MDLQTLKTNASKSFLLIKRPFNTPPNAATKPPPFFDAFFASIQQQTFEAFDVQNASASSFSPEQMAAVLTAMRIDPPLVVAASQQRDCAKLLQELCRKKPLLFLNVHVFNALIDGVRKEYTASVKAKANNAYCLLSASLLAQVFANENIKMPLEVLQAVCDDWCVERAWIGTTPALVRRIVAFFQPMAAPNTETFAAAKAPVSAEKELEVKYFVCSSIAHFGDIEKLGCVKEGRRQEAFLRYMTLGMRYDEVRAAVFPHIKRWLGHEGDDAQENSDGDSTLTLLVCNWALHCTLPPAAEAEAQVESAAEWKHVSRALAEWEACDATVKAGALLLQRAPWLQSRIVNVLFERCAAASQQQQQQLCVNRLVAPLFERAAAQAHAAFAEAVLDATRLFVDRHPHDALPFRVLAAVCQQSAASLSIVKHVCMRFEHVLSAKTRLVDVVAFFGALVGGVQRFACQTAAALFDVFLHGCVQNAACQTAAAAEAASCEEVGEAIAQLLRQNPRLSLLNARTVVCVANIKHLSCANRRLLVRLLLENTVRAAAEGLVVSADAFDVALCDALRPLFADAPSIAEWQFVLLCLAALSPGPLAAAGALMDGAAMRRLINAAIAQQLPQSSSVPLHVLLCRSRSPDFVLRFLADAPPIGDAASLRTVARLLVADDRQLCAALPRRTCIELAVRFDEAAATTATTNDDQQTAAAACAVLLRTVARHASVYAAEALRWLCVQRLAMRAAAVPLLVRFVPDAFLPAHFPLPFARFLAFLHAEATKAAAEMQVEEFSRCVASFAATETAYDVLAGVVSFVRSLAPGDVVRDAFEAACRGADDGGLCATRHIESLVAKRPLEKEAPFVGEEEEEAAAAAERLTEFSQSMLQFGAQFGGRHKETFGLPAAGKRSCVWAGGEVLVAATARGKMASLPPSSSWAFANALVRIDAAECAAEVAMCSAVILRLSFDSPVLLVTHNERCIVLLRTCCTATLHALLDAAVASIGRVFCTANSRIEEAATAFERLLLAFFARAEVDAYAVHRVFCVANALHICNAKRLQAFLRREAAKLQHALDGIAAAGFARLPAVTGLVAWLAGTQKALVLRATGVSDHVSSAQRSALRDAVHEATATLQTTAVQRVAYALEELCVSCVNTPEALIGVVEELCAVGPLLDTLNAASLCGEGPGAAVVAAAVRLFGRAVRTLSPPLYVRMGAVFVRHVLPVCVDVNAVACLWILCAELRADIAHRLWQLQGKGSAVQCVELLKHVDAPLFAQNSLLSATIDAF